MTATMPAPRSDTLVIGLVGLAHLLSHFYQIALAPLFPLLRAEFGVSYTALGLIISLFYGVSGMCQAFVGILVDRYGGDRLMLFGILIMSTSVMLMGFAPAYWVLLPLAVLSALGNSVFHPADLSILSAKVSPDRLGRAFGIHGFGGTCGYFLSPIIVYYGVASFAGWRAGLIVAGLIGWGAALLIFRYRDVLRMPAGQSAGAEAMPSLAFYGRLVRNLPLMAAFVYFALIAGALAGVQLRHRAGRNVWRAPGAGDRGIDRLSRRQRGGNPTRRRIGRPVPASRVDRHHRPSCRCYRNELYRTDPAADDRDHTAAGGRRLLPRHDRPVARYTRACRNACRSDRQGLRVRLLGTGPWRRACSVG
jgi:hypothetical protein